MNKPYNAYIEFESAAANTPKSVHEIRVCRLESVPNTGPIKESCSVERKTAAVLIF